MESSRWSPASFAFILTKACEKGRIGNASLCVCVRVCEYKHDDCSVHRIPHAKHEESFHFENLSPKSNLFRTLVCLLIFFLFSFCSTFFLRHSDFFSSFLPFLCYFFCFVFSLSTDNVITYSINNYMAETHAEQNRSCGSATWTKAKLEQETRDAAVEKLFIFGASSLHTLFYNGNFLFTTLSDSSYISAYSHHYISRQMNESRFIR